jgi:Npun R1517
MRDKRQIKVLVDADVVLELFINRNVFVEDCEELLSKATQASWLEVYITDKCLRRVRSELGETDSELGEQAATYVEEIFNGGIIRIDSALKKQARKYSLPDFDSAEELACANAMYLDAIITNNPSNFTGANLRIWSVIDLLNRLSVADLPNHQLKKIEVGVYECEIHLKFRLIEEKSLLSDREQLLQVLLDALTEGSDDFLETLQASVKAQEISEFKASPQMRRQLMRLRNFRGIWYFLKDTEC